ncbi:MAG: two-component sensor histidine kinase [Bacilli bacterium]|nr:two-component sensor histidine kinase [Bacilli bacterium]
MKRMVDGLAILFLLIAIILYFYGPKNEAIKWLIAFLIFGCLSDLSHWFGDSIWYSPLNFIYETCTSYALIMFSIVRSELTNRRIEKILSYVLTLPTIIMFFITPIRPHLEIDYKILFLWVGPYYLTVCFLLIFSYFKEMNPKKKTRRFITACVVVPITLVYLVEHSFFKAIGYRFEGFWFVSFCAAITFVVFIITLIRFGAFGVKIKFEKQLLGQTITSIASGTTMLNHAFKNRITNIDMLSGRLKETARLLQHPQMENHVELIISETRQMMHMVKRIQKQIEDIEIVEGIANLQEVVIDALQSCSLLLESKGVDVSTEYTVNVNLKCDKIHIQEVFHNLIRNAVDAMEMGFGKLSIRVSEALKGVLIEFSDNGTGIAKEISDKIFDPFFSTKHREENFGLGLTYCYLVLQKHGGRINLSRKKEKGTTFTVFLPVSRKI